MLFVNIIYFLPLTFMNINTKTHAIAEKTRFLKKLHSIRSITYRESKADCLNIAVNKK